MRIADALEFVRTHHRGVLATARRDGRPQLTPIVTTADDHGLVVISSRETAHKVRNLRRDPSATVCVFADRFYGPWVYIDGMADIQSLPEAMEPLVAYYRAIAGEHDDWDEYRRAMRDEQRVLIRIRPDRAGPDLHG